MNHNPNQCHIIVEVSGSSPVSPPCHDKKPPEVAAKVVLKNQDKRDRVVINSEPGYGKELMPRPPVPFFLGAVEVL